jgi:hypothetical protein
MERGDRRAAHKAWCIFCYLQRPLLEHDQYLASAQYARWRLVSIHGFKERSIRHGLEFPDCARNVHSSTPGSCRRRETMGTRETRGATAPSSSSPHRPPRPHGPLQETTLEPRRHEDTKLTPLCRPIALSRRMSSVRKAMTARHVPYRRAPAGPFLSSRVTPTTSGKEREPGPQPGATTENLKLAPMRGPSRLARRRSPEGLSMSSCLCGRSVLFFPLSPGREAGLYKSVFVRCRLHAGGGFRCRA